uniref:SAM domain-containing protein n=1 Tax=Timema monikensis TaxID=170555 RepID=A0A7R9HSW8_9NEOP|nr:unnamed protein product [Timema monikensis]
MSKVALRPRSRRIHDLFDRTWNSPTHIIPNPSQSTPKLTISLKHNFREQRIDGSGLPLLTEDHLTSTLGMKLGPALKLRATLARRLGHCSICQHCVHCHVTSVPTASVSPTQTPLAVRPNSTGN